jgi:HAD superfamily hydrolase (TIGR01509 family)
MTMPLARPKAPHPPAKASAPVVEAVLLDVDGTLIDSNEAHAKAWQEALACFGCAVSVEEARRQMGKGGDELMPGFLTQEEIARRGAEIEARCGEVFKAKYLDELRAFPGTRALVQRLLRDGRQVLLASSAGGDELENYKRLAQIHDLVHDGASRDDVDRSKPHPDIFEAALGKLNGTPRERVVVIGDSPYDAEAAGKAGVRTIGVLSGGFGEEELREAGCVAVYRDVADLLAQYDASPLGGL